MLVSLSFAKILSAREINRPTNFPKAVQRSEAGFNPSRDSVDCTIVTRSRLNFDNSASRDQLLI